MKIKKVCVLIGFLGQMIYSQDISIPIEIFSTQEHLYYQHSFYKTIRESKFSFFNLTSLKTSYAKASENKSYLIRNQLFYKIHKNWKLGLTAEVKNKDEAFRFGIQYLFKNNELILSIYSNIAIANKTSFVHMLFTEYKPKISKNLYFYSRLQMQTSTNLEGNTNYSNLYRIGVEYKYFKLGIGTPWFDPSNSKIEASKHVGMFMGVIL